MPTKLTIAVYVLLICLCIIIFSGCCSTSESTSSDYKWYVKIYMPDGVIEGPGRIIIASNSGVVSVEIDGIQYKVGSQNILVRKLPDP
jgi:hypothetical protein